MKLSQGDHSCLFQFTHPGRGATLHFLNWLTIEVVSIHAPREGCDSTEVLVKDLSGRVSIHAPREGCDALLV